MQPDDFKYLLKRLSCTRERLSEYLYDRIAPCRVEFAPESKPRFWPPPETGWQTVSPGYAWGDAWQYGWFRLTCDWTKEHSGTEPVLDLRMGGEGLVYTENGTPLTAISLYSTYAPTSEKHFVRLGHPAPEGPMTFYVRCAAHFFNGLLIAPGEVPHRTPMNYTEYKAVFAHADIGRINATLQRYLFLLHHFEGLLKSTNANPEAPSFIARKWAAAVRDSLNLYAEDFRNLPAALNFLEESVLHPAEGWRPTAHAVGHAHLDIAWLWPVSEGVQKAARTFSEQITNIERQPGYIFGASQAYLYEQEHYRRTAVTYKRKCYTRIRNRVRYNGNI